MADQGEGWLRRSVSLNGVLSVFHAPNDPSIDATGEAWNNNGNEHAGAASYHSNWHAFGGGWDEDWQVGGKARIPSTFADGTSNTIGYLERYAICGPGNKAKPSSPWDTLVERMPSGAGKKTGRSPGRSHSITILAAPGARQRTGFPADPRAGAMAVAGSRTSAVIPPDYPIDRATGVSAYFVAPQVSPSIANCDPLRLQSFGSGGIQVLLMDGSVRSVGVNTSTVTWVRALLPNDGFVARQ